MTFFVWNAKVDTFKNVHAALFNTTDQNNNNKQVLKMQSTTIQIIWSPIKALCDKQSKID